jgi:ABC-type transport system substrate-binding protein
MPPGLISWRFTPASPRAPPGASLRSTSSKSATTRLNKDQTGAYAYGGYAEIDELFRQQTAERDRSQREALLHQIQRLMHERVMHAPIYEPATLHGVGPRVEEPGVGLNALLYFTDPYEEMRLRRP